MRRDPGVRVSPRLHSLADLATLFGPDAKAPVIKNGASAEAARREVDAMQAITNDRALFQPDADFVIDAPRNVRGRHQSVEEWLESMVERSQDAPVTATITLTPALAAALLARNPENRKVSEVLVEKYARDIATGRYTFNGESIIVSRDGFLNDGQHRCSAVVMAKRSLTTVIVFGPERDSRMTLGQGKVRTVGDYIAMQGRPDAIAQGAIAGYIYQYRTHGRISVQTYLRPTKSEILATIEANPDIETSLSAIHRKGSSMLGGRSLLAFCHWVFAKRDRAGADAFMAALCTGAAGGDARNPILVARNRLLAERRLPAPEKAELLFRAWNAHRRAERRYSLRIEGGVLPAVAR